MNTEKMKEEVYELNRQKMMALEVGDFVLVEYLQHRIEDLYRKIHEND